MIADPKYFRTESGTLAPLRVNSFDFVRFVAAVSVLLSHHLVLSGLYPEPYIPGIKDTLGGAAVSAFFGISGFLIFKSGLSASDWADYFSARILRLFPNLLVCVFTVALVTLVVFDNYDNWRSHAEWVLWNLQMILTGGVDYAIDGIFEEQPNTSVNGSLWTLPYEFWMYVLVFPICLLKSQFRLITLISVYFLFCHLWANGSWQESSRFLTIGFVSLALGKLGAFFMAGAIVSLLFSDYIRRSANTIIGYSWLAIALLVAAAAQYLLSAGNVVFPIAITFALLVVCLNSSFSWFSKLGDPSYGIYLYSFPIQQICLIYFDDFLISLLVTLIFAIGVGYLTWHGFEKRCLTFRSPLARALRHPFNIGTDQTKPR